MIVPIFSSFHKITEYDGNIKHAEDNVYNYSVLKNIIGNFELCFKNIMFASHNQFGAGAS